MKISVVTTLYKSAEVINEFHARVSNVARILAGDDYEIVVVNDGSPDDSLNRMIAISEFDSHVTVVDLSRNFGHHKAIMTGLAYSRGEQIFLIDSDLEEPPECLLEFASLMRDKACDVVYGVQKSRKGGWFERWSGELFYVFFRILTGIKLPKNSTTARLMTRRYVTALLRHQEREVFLAGLWYITGFSQEPSLVAKLSFSTTTYTFGKKISLLVNSVTSFSNLPLILIFYFGVTVSVLSVLYIGYLVFSWTFLEKPLTGWTSVMASIWLMGGFIISFIGVVGIYLSKIFSETKQRPYTIVRQVHGER